MTDAQDYEQDSTYLLGIYAKLWTLPAPTCNALPRGCLEAHRRRPEAVVLGGLWEWHSGCLDCYLFRWLMVTLLNCYFEIQRGIEIQWADPDFSVASSCIQITLRTYRPMAHNPSIHVNPSQPTSLVHQADKKYCAADYSFQYVLLFGCCVTRKPRNFSAGRQTSTWAPILRSPTDSFSFAPSKSRQLAARKGGHVSVASVVGGHEETPWLFSVSAWPISLRGRSCIGFAAGSGPMCWARSKAFKAWWVVWGQNLSWWNWSVGCHRSRLRIPRFGHGTCMMVKKISFSFRWFNRSTLYV